MTQPNKVFMLQFDDGSESVVKLKEYPVTNSFHAITSVFELPFTSVFKLPQALQYKKITRIFLDE